MTVFSTLGKQFLHKELHWRPSSQNEEVRLPRFPGNTSKQFLSFPSAVQHLTSVTGVCCTEGKVSTHKWKPVNAKPCKLMAPTVSFNYSSFKRMPSRLSELTQHNGNAEQPTIQFTQWFLNTVLTTDSSSNAQKSYKPGPTRHTRQREARQPQRWKLSSLENRTCNRVRLPVPTQN